MSYWIRNRIRVLERAMRATRAELWELKAFRSLRSYQLEKDLKEMETEYVELTQYD